MFWIDRKLGFSCVIFKSLTRGEISPLIIVHSSTPTGIKRRKKESSIVAPNGFNFMLFHSVRPSGGIPLYSSAVSCLHLWVLTCAESHIAVLWESLFVCVCVCVCVCVRGAVNQLCSPREGTALFTDPFKANMVERVVKVGQEKYKT